MILFIALPVVDDKGPGVAGISLAQLPRHCPFCDRDTIVGHGRRRKQAHDDKHDWIWVRRGRCPPCKKTFTVLPVWSPPYGHYSYECRRQACDAVAEGNPATYCRDSTRLPDDSTLRRWSWCRFISVLFGLVMSRLPMRADFFSTPTILAWDFPAASRILHLEANSP